MNPSDLAVAYGNQGFQLVVELLQAMDISGELAPEMRVMIKPNLVMAREASSGITTHPELVEGTIRYLLDAGVRDITIAESSWTGGDTRRAFRVCGYEELVDRYGRFGVTLLDLKGDTIDSASVRGVRFQVFGSVLNTDYLINMPVLKGHGTTKLTCALKNLKGCIPDAEKRRYHAEGLHEPIALLNTLIPQDLVIVDGLCGDPTSETGGNPLAMDRVILGKDPVLIDSYVAELMGYRPRMIEHIRLAERFSVGSMDTGSARIRELGTPRFRNIPPPDQRRLQRIQAHISERQACSACYGSTVYALQRLEESRGLEALRERVCVGQGYRGIRMKGTGVGTCAKGLSRSLLGCPPTAREIYGFLASSLKDNGDA